MKSLRLCTDGAGDSKLESLPLPFINYERSDLVGLVGQRVGEHLELDLQRPELVPQATSFRTVRHEDGHVEAGPGGQTRHLAFLISGMVEVAAANEMKAVLRPGDVLFVDDLSSSGHTMTYRGDCRVIQVEMSDSWAPKGEVAPALDDDQPGAEDAPNINEMYCGDDDETYLRSFDQLFPATPGATPPRPIVGIRFLCSPAGIVSDWHCHPTNSLIIKLAGDGDIEVGGGGGAIVRSRPGNVLVALESHGRGHTGRQRRQSRSADLVLADEHLWTDPS